MSLPRAPATLPDDFAAALGQAVAGFGFLEEALKRAIYALSRDCLGDEPREAELDAWVMRMEQIADDSLGTLIDAFVTACERDAVPVAERRALSDLLREVRDRRNMLCHASWRPAEGGGWRPGFVSTRGVAVPARMVASDLDAIREETLAAAGEVIGIARRTGHDRWRPDAPPGPEELERARAAARSAVAAARPRLAPPPLGDADEDRDEDEDGRWHPLDALADARPSRARKRQRRESDRRRHGPAHPA